jgi:uncharacterized protein YhaN
MKFLDFFIKGFGIYENVEVKGLSSGMNLYIGENEAGKSTLLSFIRDVLFGFETGRSQYNSYKPLGNAEHGGRISLVTDRDQKKYVIERGPGRATGNAVVTLPDGTHKGEEVIPELLPGITKDVYRSIYGFSLDELQDIGSLSGSDVSNRIYSYGVGAGPVSPVDVEGKLTAKMETFYKPGGSRPEVNTLFSEIAAVEENIKNLSKQTEEYFASKNKMPALDDEIESLEKNIANVQEQINLLEKLQNAWIKWEEINRSNDELANIPLIDSFPEDGVGRYNRCKENIAKSTDNLNRLNREIASIRDELSQLKIERQLIDAKAEIVSILQSREHYEKAKTDLPVIKSEEDHARQELSILLNNCGPGWTEARALSFDISLIAKEQINQMGKQLDQSERDLEAAKNRLEIANVNLSALEKDANDKEAKLKSAESSTISPQKLAEMGDAVRLARQNIITLERINFKKDATANRVKELEDERDSKEHSVKSGANSIVPVLSAIFAAICIIAGIAFFRSSSILSVLLIVIGVVVLGAGLYFYRQLKNQQAHVYFELESLNGRIQNGSKDIEESQAQISREQESIRKCSQMLNIAINTMQDVDHAEGNLQAEHDKSTRLDMARNSYEDIQKAVNAAKNEVERCRAQRTQCQMSYEDNLRKWKLWLEDKNLPASLSMDGVKELMRTIEAIRDKINQAQEKANRVQQMNNTVSDNEEKIRKLLSDCGRDVPETSLLIPALLKLQDDVEVAEANMQKQASMEKDVNRLVGERFDTENELQRYRDEANELMLIAGAADENEFHVRNKHFLRREELKAVLQNCNGNLKLIAGKMGTDELKSKLSATDKNTIEQSLQSLNEKLKEQRKKCDEKLQERGECKKSIEQLEKSDEQSIEQSKKEALYARLNNAASEWAALAICRALLEKTRERYEKERQPKVIQSASDIIKRMTNGVYIRVLSPLGQQRFEMETSSEERKEVGVLSRGTREQLYLAIRFGLIKEYSGEPLPVIMDDILVNFDPKRVMEAAKSILELSETHQVLFFTCHPEIKDLFLGLNSQIPLYNVRQGKILAN